MKVCDNTSVGMIIKNSKGEILLIERGKKPFGFAPPAGHVDDHGSFDQAAKDETKEEVGLDVKSLKLLIEGRMENSCRRSGGAWHYWKIYEVETTGNISRSLDETKQAGWYELDKIKLLAKRAEKYRNGKISEDEWEQYPGLEPGWVDWFEKINILQ